jgi:uncharacterized membrane protein
MASLAPFHPRIVHFPIALALVGVFFIFLRTLAPRLRPRADQADFWGRYGRLSLLLGLLGVLAAMASGLIDQGRATVTPQVADAISQHITAGVALFIALGLALYWPLRDKALWSERRHFGAYLALLALVAGLVLLESWLGGRLVYHYGVGVR